MSEYNIQMNKYNALNAKYDQLYPATKIKNVDGLDTALQNKADLGEDGKVPESQLPAMDYAPRVHTHAQSDVSGLIDALASKAPAYTYGTTDLTAGSSALATGTMYLCYE